jgi:hypothetical protein
VAERAEEQVAERRIVTIARSSSLALGLQAPGDSDGLRRQRLFEVPKSFVGAAFARPGAPCLATVQKAESATGIESFESKSCGAYNRDAALTARSDCKNLARRFS